ncbi:TPA: MFS transporter [Serratia fonticola]
MENINSAIAGRTTAALSQRPSNQRYIVALMLFITVIINYVDRANLAIASPAIEKEFGLNQIEMGYIFAAFGWTYALFMIPGGRILDVAGSKITYFIAILGWSVATLFQGFSTGFLSLFGLRAITGAFEAPAFPTNNRVISSWFPENERAGAIALYTSGQYVGLAFLTPFLVWLMNVTSWHWVFIFTGTLGIVWSLVWFFKYKPITENKKVNAAELEYVINGGGIIDIASDANSQKKKLTKKDWKNVFHPKLLGVYFVQFSLSTTSWFFLTWFPSYISKGRDINVTTTGIMTALPFVAAFLGVISGGFLVNKLMKMGKGVGFSRRVPIISGLLLSMVIVGANYTDNINLIVLMLGIAFFGNGFASQAWSLVSSIAPTHLIGLSGGCFNFFGGIGGMSVPIIVGYLAQYYGFAPALVYIAVIAFMSILAFLALTRNVERIA